MKLEDFVRDLWTREYYKEFEIALDSNNNSKIENTILYRALNTLLSADNKPFQCVIDKNSIFYRARVINDVKLLNNENGISKIGNEFTGLNAFQSKEPPLGVAPEGRNNISGASYLYLSKSKYTACVEIYPNRGDLISLAKFATYKTLHVADFVTNESIVPIKKLEQEYLFNASKLITRVMEKYCEPKSNASSYKISQYISDMIRKKGYDGVIYASSFSRKKNLTLFNCDESYIKFIKSNLFFCSCKMPIDIYDLSTYKRLTPKSHKLKKTELDEIRESLEKKLKKELN